MAAITDAAFLTDKICTLMNKERKGSNQFNTKHPTMQSPAEVESVREKKNRPQRSLSPRQKTVVLSL